MNAVAAALIVIAMQKADAPKLDHIMLGAPDLDQAIVAFQRATGVEPVRGGKHPGRGTENALISLGGGTYLEIIAPQKNGSATDELAAELHKLDGLTPIGWALRVTDAAATRAQLENERFAVTPLSPGSRVTPAGEKLAWTTFDVDGFETAPFFIEWSRATRHPSTTSPGGCSLRTFVVSEPSGSDLLRLVRAIGVDTVVGISTKSMMSVTLRCGERVATFATR
jgi:hypothetical protein